MRTVNKGTGRVNSCPGSTQSRHQTPSRGVQAPEVTMGGLWSEELAWETQRGSCREVDRGWEVRHSKCS